MQLRQAGDVMVELPEGNTSEPRIVSSGSSVYRHSIDPQYLQYLASASWPSAEQAGQA